MTSFTLPAFCEGTIRGYDALLQFITRSFNARRIPAVRKAAFLSDVAAAFRELADSWRARAFVDAYADADLAAYLRVGDNGQPKDPKLFGKEFVRHGIHCQAIYCRVDCAQALLNDEDFLACDEARDIAAALEQYTAARERADELLAHLNDQCAAYLHLHGLPTHTYNLRHTLKIIDK